MRKVLIILFFGFIFQSCDPGYNVEIINESDNQIEIIFNYNEESIIEDINRNIRFKPEVVYNCEHLNIAFEIDTTRYIVNTLLEPNDTLVVENGIGRRADFDNIKSITINSYDTLHIHSNNDIIKAFSQPSKYLYELKIKK